MQIKVEWSELKQFLEQRNVPAQYVEFNDTYIVIGIDGKISLICKVAKVETPEEGSDQKDFEDNFKPSGNTTFTDSDGNDLSRSKVTQTGWQYHMQGVEFGTSQLNSVYNKDDAGNDLGFASIKLYNSAGTEITDQPDAENTDPNIGCVKTVVDWEPDHDYEIIGGALKMDQSTTEDIRLYVIAVPDIPKAYGGSKDFICCVNMKYIEANDKVEADGRASKKLKYDPDLHTNKVRIVLNHGPGVKCNFLMTFEVFKV